MVLTSGVTAVLGEITGYDAKGEVNNEVAGISGSRRNPDTHMRANASTLYKFIMHVGITLKNYRKPTSTI